MAKSKEPDDSDAIEGWLRAELEGGLFAYVTVDTQAWARDLAARMRAADYKLSDRAFRSLRKKVEDHTATRLARLREDAEWRGYEEVAEDSLSRGGVGPEALRVLLSGETRQLGEDLQQVSAQWSKRVLERLDKELPEATKDGRDAVVSVVAARLALCFRWISEIRKWGEGRQDQDELPSKAPHKKPAAAQ